MKKRYRMTSFTSRQAKIYANRVVPLLGAIKRIKAYQITSDRKGLLTNREQLLIIGENGTARLNGVCWGYNGEGPRTVYEILRLCGVNGSTASMLAFDSDRLNKDGTSWEWQTI